ncbi:glycosyltransferase [Streptomyces echinoruber]|uniref:DOD-type homing endonuclease domain-containing protein n=1 Tax=Streptomyces echinoruber TaxID=68898 RepID=A0A918RJE1_9ACTN|nr:glycosyltransferase [Streptomyces echinoruber]GHA01104.1 hypothetical protein GCM10010389_45540 [Streptomyces echinoruber]
MSLTVTVLVPAHNEADTITRCIAAVRASTYPVEQIIVVADACTDNTAQLARDAGADLVLETDFQDKAAAQNAALWSITTDLVIGFDGDTWPDADCIRLMVEHIERDGLDATCSTILPAQGAVVPYSKTGLLGRAQAAFFTRSRRFAYALGRRWWRLCQAKVGRIQVLTGACYAFKTAAIQGIGGFPNGLITADMDATWALHGAGYRLDYTGDALAWTLDPEDFRTYRNQMRRWSSGYYQNMAKHRRQLKNWRSLLVVGGAIFDLVSLFFTEGYLIWSAVTGTHPALLKAFVFWTAVHTVVSTALVATVVGVREAVLGVIPYTLVNYYNKWLYLCGFVREWVLGRHYACVDEKTEALTPYGWRRHSELKDGDLIAAYDAEIDRLYWEPAKFVRYDVVEQLVAIEQTSTSQRLTETHRVFVDTEKRGRHVKLAGDVSKGCKVPLSAPWEPLELTGPGEKRAALLGWFIAEGWRDGNQAVISQSETVNPHKCQAIRDLLDAVGADWRERRRDRPAGASLAPGERVQIEFVIQGEIAEWLTSVVPPKSLTPDVVFGWPEAECRALLDALVDGDGHRREGNRLAFVQKDRGTAEMFQCLAIRCGLHATIRQRESDGVWWVYVNTKRWVSLRGRNGEGSGPLPREPYEGVVWCPMVRTGFWMARRNGKPFITGNSWTGRQGRKTVITPMTLRRRWALGQISVVAGALAMAGGGYLGSGLLFALGAALAVVVPLALVPWRGTGKRRADRHPAPAAAPAVDLPDDDTVRLRIPLAKLLDPETEQTLTLPIPHQRTAAHQPDGIIR